MTRYVANAGVQPKLDAKVVQVVDHRHHAVWEEAWERDKLARGVVSAWMPAIVEDNVILHTEYRIQNMAVVGLDRSCIVTAILITARCRLWCSAGHLRIRDLSSQT